MKKTFWIGLFVIFVFTLFITGILFIQDISIRNSNYSFSVIFEDVQGLYDGDDVKMLGKRIGRVTQTKIQKDRIAVELTIDNSFAFRIPIDSKIEVKSEGLLGSKYVSIIPGNDPREFILAGEIVEGQRDYDFSEITPGIVPMTQDLAVFARRLKAVLGEQEKNSLREIINNLESLTSNIDELSKSSSELVNNKQIEAISAFIKNIELFSESILKMSDNEIDNFVKNLSNSSDEFLVSVNAFKDASIKMSLVARDLGVLLEDISKSNNSINKLINSSELHDNLNNVFLDASSLIKDIENNPTKYIKAYIKAK
tara:strand:- start:179 stop:1114 length:936 start_codon:yes stop_codon:yes gene_type:complete